jgi:hypothetical protein
MTAIRSTANNMDQFRTVLYMIGTKTTLD